MLNPLDAWGREEFCSEVAQILIGARPEERIHLSGIEHRRGENRCGAGWLQDGRRVPPAHQVGLSNATGQNKEINLGPHERLKVPLSYTMDRRKSATVT